MAYISFRASSLAACSGSPPPFPPNRERGGAGKVPTRACQCSLVRLFPLFNLAVGIAGWLACLQQKLLHRGDPLPSEESPGAALVLYGGPRGLRRSWGRSCLRQGLGFSLGLRLRRGQGGQGITPAQSSSEAPAAIDT